jgi:hypothetical protein
MIELDPSKNAPCTPLETAQISRKYLETLGYTFPMPRAARSGQSTREGARA